MIKIKTEIHNGRLNIENKTCYINNYFSQDQINLETLKLKSTMEYSNQPTSALCLAGTSSMSPYMLRKSSGLAVGLKFGESTPRSESFWRIACISGWACMEKALLDLETLNIKRNRIYERAHVYNVY